MIDAGHKAVRRGGGVDGSRHLYLRLRDQMIMQILDGLYQEGDALPSVRAVAAETGANPLTVAKAYQFFVESGVAKILRGRGLFLAEGGADRLRASEKVNFLNDHWPKIKRDICRLGLTADELRRSDFSSALPLSSQRLAKW